jgi:hypothetical protein
VPGPCHLGPAPNALGQPGSAGLLACADGHGEQVVQIPARTGVVIATRTRRSSVLRSLARLDSPAVRRSRWSTTGPSRARRTPCEPPIPPGRSWTGAERGFRCVAFSDDDSWGAERAMERAADLCTSTGTSPSWCAACGWRLTAATTRCHRRRGVRRSGTAMGRAPTSWRSPSPGVAEVEDRFSAAHRPLSRISSSAAG